jgi:hypothetical protein
LKLSSVAASELDFTDIKGHWAQNYIEEIYRFKIIKGYEDGMFKPNNKITRAEVVTMFNRMLYRGPLNGVESKFPDAPKSHWAFGQIIESATDHKYTRNTDGSELIAK